MADQKTEYAPPAQPPPHDSDPRSLPKGWIRQFDNRSATWFYVDTSASPPRSSWVHPYDDPQYLSEHPDAHFDAHPEGHDIPPEYPRNASYPSQSAARHEKKGKRSFLGKLKDMAIGTKEERDAAKRLRELERQERLARRRAHAAQYGAPPQMYPGQYQQYPAGYMYGPGIGQSRGGGNVALPLLGGLAGGLLLGEMMGGGFGDGFGDGGDFGGGGGDFGGGF